MNSYTSSFKWRSFYLTANSRRKAIRVDYLATH